MDTTTSHPTSADRPALHAVPDAPPATLEAVRDVLVRTLGIEDRVDTIDAGTALLGELPELDSLGILELATALEVRFGIVVDDSDFTGAVFETLGSLVSFVQQELGTR